MSIHRTMLVAGATLFTAVTTSGAFACCGGWGGGWGGGYGPVAPVVYGSYAPTYATAIAAAPIVVGGGCGGCGVPTAAAVFAAPVAPAPLLYGGWAGGC